MPTFDIDEVVDATGAGDAFLAATLVHLSDGAFDEDRVREAARRGGGRGARLHGLRRHERPAHRTEMESFMEGQRA